MFVIASLSPPDLIVLFIIALVVFGPKRLPEVGRQVGGMMRDLRKLSQEFTGALMGVHDEVHNAVSPVISNVMGREPHAAELRPAERSFSSLPVPEGEAAGVDSMAAKAEFGETVTERSRRGVTLSTLPPEDNGEA